jgi:hypothetical protein
MEYHGGRNRQIEINYNSMPNPDIIVLVIPNSFVLTIS